MRSLIDMTDARTALRSYLETAGATLPTDTFAQLVKLSDSPAPVDQICRSAELLYARRDELDDAGRELTGQLSSFAAQYHFHGMSTDNRGGRIALAMQRDMGETPAPGLPPFPEPETDPKPDQAFVKEEPANATPSPTVQ